MEKFKLVVTAVGLVAVPTTAFLIRMAKGDTHNENEEIISKVIQEIIKKMTERRTEKISE